MLAFVEQALIQHGLMEAYRNHPPYQQNDYLGWIMRAKQIETQQQRLAQMLAELVCHGCWDKVTPPSLGDWLMHKIGSINFQRGKIGQKV